MKLRIERKNLLPVLRNVQTITKQNKRLAIVQNVLIKTVDDKLSIAATDLSTSVESIIGAEVKTEGVVCLNAEKLFQIVDRIPDETISMVENDQFWVEITGKNIKHNLAGSNPDDYPAIQEVKPDDFVSIPSDTLKNMLSKACDIMNDPDDKRAHAIGMLFKITDGLFEVVSTDGSRLNYSKYQHEVKSINWDDILLQKSGIKELLKSIDEPFVDIGLSFNHFVIKQDNKTLKTRVLEGNFPKHETIFERAIDVKSQHIKLNINESISLFRQMEILTNENYKGVFITFSDGKMQAVSTNPDSGDSAGHLKIDYEGPIIEFALNTKYIIDALNSIGGENAFVFVTDGEMPVMFQRGEDFKTVVMPMKV